MHRVISTTPAARQCAVGEHHESEASVNLQLAHPNPAYGKVGLIEPAPLGYMHIGAEVRPPARPGPIVPSRERSQLVGGLKVLGRQVERVDGVQKVTVYEAIAFAPPSSYVRQRSGVLQPAPRCGGLGGNPVSGDDRGGPRIHRRPDTGRLSDRKLP